jgi:hypothetical protein
VSEYISVSKLLHFVQGAGLLNERAKGLHKRLITVEVHGSLSCPPFRFLFYSTWDLNKSRLFLYGGQHFEHHTACFIYILYFVYILYLVPKG